jgi:excisionase family DNA binding protein
MTPEQVPELLGELEVVRATAVLKMSAPPSLPQCGELLNVEEAAKRLGVSTDYLYRHAAQFSFTRRMGRKLLFHSGGVDHYINRVRR